jgi:hypothetical protein
MDPCSFGIACSVTLGWSAPDLDLPRVAEADLDVNSGTGGNIPGIAFATQARP